MRSEEQRIDALLHGRKYQYLRKVAPLIELMEICHKSDLYIGTTVPKVGKFILHSLDFKELL